MKRYHRILTYLLLLILVLLSVSCTPSESVVQTAIAQTQIFNAQIQTAIAQTQSADSKSTPVILNPTPTESLITTSEPTSTVKPTDRPKTISLLQTKRFEKFCELMITEVYFEKIILPSNPGRFYSYYEAKSIDTTYLDVVIILKNLTSNAKTADGFASVSILYDNEYKYDAFPVFEYLDGTNFTYANITAIAPLLTATLHYLVEVPTSMENSSKPLVVVVKISGEEYQYRYR